MIMFPIQGRKSHYENCERNKAICEIFFIVFINTKKIMKFIES